MIRSRENPGTPTRGKTVHRHPGWKKDPSPRELLFGEKICRSLLLLCPPPAKPAPWQGRLRRFHLGKGRESQQRIRTFPKGSACGTPATAPFPGSDAPPLPANVPVWEGCRVAGAPPPLPGRSDPETPRYPPATIRSDTGRRCALSGGVPLLLPRFSVLYSPKDHPVVQTCARQGTYRQTSHPVFSWKNGMKTCEFFVVIL